MLHIAYIIVKLKFLQKNLSTIRFHISTFLGPINLHRNYPPNNILKTHR